jgi:putative colanic acid biosynthesis UDP-glucose lipid carrier transferase
MYRRGIIKEHATLFNVALRVLDMLAILASAWLAHVIYIKEWKMHMDYPVIMVVTMLLMALLFPAFHLYRPWRGISFVDEVRVVSLAWGATLLGLLAIIFMADQGGQFSRGWVLWWAGLGWVLLLVARLVVRALTRLARTSGRNLRHVVLVGTSIAAKEVVNRLQTAPWSGINVAGIFYVGDDETEQQPLTGVPTLGEVHELACYVDTHGIDQVWIALPLKEEAAVKDVLYLLRHSTVDVRYIPDLFGFRLLNHSISEVAGMFVLDLSVSPMNGVNRLVKALEDRILAALILLLISPLMAVIALGVKLTSSGPVIYRQERVGWNGVPFMILKFRSMPRDIEENGAHEWGNARGKVTSRFGMFLRRTSLDELPQFINVLRGEMSIVGPRPERTEFVEKFKDDIPDYMKKHLVKAGITGWAQVNGWRGDTDLNKRIEHDLYYIENWSLWFDLKIILLTVFRVLFQKSAC